MHTINQFIEGQRREAINSMLRCWAKYSFYQYPDTADSTFWPHLSTITSWNFCAMVQIVTPAKKC